MRFAPARTQMPFALQHLDPSNGRTQTYPQHMHSMDCAKFGPAAMLCCNAIYRRRNQQLGQSSIIGLYRGTRNRGMLKFCYRGFTTGRRLPADWPETEPEYQTASHGHSMNGEAKLSPEGEAIAAYGTATMAAFRVLIACLQRNGVLQRGEFAEALDLFLTAAEPEVDAMPLSILRNLRMAMLD